MEYSCCAELNEVEKKITREEIYLDESLHHANKDDDAWKLKGSRKEQVKEGRAADCSSKDSVCWIG